MARIGCAGASRKLACAAIMTVAAMLMSASAASAAGGVGVLTPSLGFGRAVLGAGNTVTKDVELFNATSATLQLTSMQLTGGISDFTPSFANGTTCPTPDAGSSAGVAPGTSCQVTVTYSPATLGPVSGQLDMTFCAPDSTSCITTSKVSLAAEGVHAETLTLNPSPLSFTSTPLGTSSQAQTVTLTNGPEPMLISALSFGGLAPHDFATAHDGCTGTDLAAGASCTFDVSFTPSAAGARNATVTVDGATLGNPYPTLTLSGLGSALPASPIPPTAMSPGTTTTHPTTGGTTHSGGAPRPFDDAELVTCRAVTTRTGHPSRKVKIQRCTARRISGSLKFTANGTPATISRGKVVYGKGWATSRGTGRWQLLIHRLRPLRPGVYTLTLRTPHGARHAQLKVT
jgi:hypothetical protein